MDNSAVPTTESQRLLATLEQLLAIPAINLKSALDEAAQAIAEVLAVDKVDAFLYDPDSASLVAVGTSATPLGQRQRQIGLDRLPLANGGRTVAVYQTGVSIHCARTAEDPDELIGIKYGLGVRSRLAALITVGEERRGVLSIDSVQPERFSEEDLRFCETVARWVGLVAQRAQLTEQMLREAGEAALRAGQEYYRALFEAAPIGIFIADAHDHREAVNDTYCALTGYTRNELLGAAIGGLYAAHPLYTLDQRADLVTEFQTRFTEDRRDQREYTFYTNLRPRRRSASRSRQQARGGTSRSWR